MPASLDPYTQRLFQIESGGNPYAVTGSNRGLGQFGPQEEQMYGITPQNRNDAGAQAAAVAAERAHHSPILSQALGRDPSPGELYLMHQQGIAGGPALLSANPNMPAWQVIRPFYKSDAIAKQAITGNIGSDSPLHRMSADQIAAGAFTGYWKDKFEGGMAPGSLAQADQPATGSPPGMPTQAGDTPLPAGGFPTAMAAGLPSGAQNAPSGLSGAQGANPFASLGQAGQQMMQSPPITPMPWMQLPMASRPQLDLSKLQAIATNPALRPLG